MTLPETQKLGHYNGGVKLKRHKSESLTKPIQIAPLPDKLVIPLQQHIGSPCDPLVTAGDYVYKGQIIARSRDYVSVPIHASSSGTVSNIGDYEVPHPSGLSARCIEITTDKQDAWYPELVAYEDYENTDREVLRQHVREMGLVGLGGAAFPSFIKLNPGMRQGIDTLIINAAECEPYISCDNALMRERATEIIEGITILRYLLNANRVLVGIEDDMEQAYEALQTAVQAANAGITLVPVPTRYPSGGEKQLINLLTGKEVPSNGLPIDVSVICHNVGTAYAVFQAVMLGHPLISRIVTVTGPGIAAPQNIDALIGTGMHELTSMSGGYSGAEPQIIMGGPMMGFELQHDRLPIIKATNCLLINARQSLPKPQQAYPCIRCGACAQACPAKLLPQQLYWYANSGEFDRVQDYHLFDCIECGCCAYVCPSHIPLVQYYRYAKNEIWSQELEKQKSDRARLRFETRSERIEKQKRELEEKRKRKKAALNKDKGKDKDAPTEDKSAIEEALQRVKSKQSANDTPQERMPDKDNKTD